jgi:heme-degrading monooxygenase HmoA
MFVRQGSFEVIPGKLAELRQIYSRDCAPLVRASRGNVDVYLLEPTENDGSIVACTIWETQQEAIAYEASGTAKEVVSKVKRFFARPPTLRSYRMRR